MPKVLGLDVGTNSLGWALLDTDKQEIIDGGVRVFSEGVTDMNTSKEQSKNAERRQFRMSRKQYDRRRRRKEKLRNRLQALLMMPKDNLSDFYRMNPYPLRKKALDEQLTLWELGRVLYHLNQRRGFLSNRKTKSEEESKGVINIGSADKPGINAVITALQSGKYRTLGEYLASLDTTEQRIRNRFTQRSHHEEEFNTIWDFQKQFYPDILDETNKTYIAKKCVFFQRPLKSQKSTLGKCPLEPQKSRAPKSQPLSQKFRLLQTLNNLRIITPDRITDEQQILKGKEWDTLYKYLSNHDKLDIEKKPIPKELKKELGYKTNDTITFNIKQIHGLKTMITLRKALGENHFNTLTEEQIHTMWYVLYGAEHEEWVMNYAQKTWGVTKEQAEKLAKTSFEPGYMNLSTKAMKKILPFMELGERYDEAAAHAGYHHSDLNKNDGSAPFLSKLKTENLRNPIVTVSLAQMRKVVNCIIEEYGKPDEIHIELARDLKKPLKQRLEILKNQKEREQRRLEIKEIIRSEDIAHPSQKDILRYELWSEAGERCPYTGQKITLKRLFSTTTDIDVEHILPYSRTLDNSVMNLTICVREENNRKGNNTPWEYYSGNEEQFEEIKERIKNMPEPKRKRFVMNDAAFEKFMTTEEGGDFLERQLHDTGYIAKETRKMLTEICTNVIVTKGTATADLRHLWEMDDILGLKEKLDESTGELSPIKNRDDHRHHAVDAVIIALTSRSALQKLSTWNSYDKFNRRRAARQTLEKPWEDLREQTKRMVANIIVSHKVNKRLRGSLHEATIYGRLKNPLTGDVAFDEKGLPYYVVRKSIQGFADTNPVYKIVDPIVKEIVIQRLIEKGIDEKKLRGESKEKIPKDAFTEPLYMKAGEGKKAPKIESVRLAVPASKMVQLYEKVGSHSAFVEPGNNHHITIFEKEIKGKITRKGIIVTLFEVIRRKSQQQQPVRRNHEDWRFVNSLRANELFIRDKHPDEVDLRNKLQYHTLSKNVYRVQKLTEGEITLRHHTSARLEIMDNEGKKVPFGRWIATPNTLSGFKVKVNPIGKLEFDND